MSPKQDIGPCEHDVIDDICCACSVIENRRRIQRTNFLPAWKCHEFAWQGLGASRCDQVLESIPQIMGDLESVGDLAASRKLEELFARYRALADMVPHFAEFFAALEVFKMAGDMSVDGLNTFRGNVAQWLDRFEDDTPHRPPLDVGALEYLQFVVVCCVCHRGRLVLSGAGARRDWITTAEGLIDLGWLEFEGAEDSRSCILTRDATQSLPVDFCAHLYRSTNAVADWENVRAAVALLALDRNIR